MGGETQGGVSGGEGVWCKGVRFGEAEIGLGREGGWKGVGEFDVRVVKGVG